jgi:dihydrofolate reductase
MGKVIVVQFVTLDGIVEDPDGSDGTPAGGWAFRFGREAVAGDKFKVGPMLDTGVLLLGRSTWELFSHLWPNRTDEFAIAMNRVQKAVVSRTAPDLDGWANSYLLEEDLEAGVARMAQARDVIVVGSTSVVHALTAADLVDEYRLLVFPAAVGVGKKLFIGPQDLEMASAEASGPAVLVSYRRAKPGALA